MIKRVFTPICLTLVLLVSCVDQDMETTRDDYLMFGHFYGFCSGEDCIAIFKLSESQIFEDNNDQYPNSSNFYVGSFSPLSDEKFEMTKDLKDNFPMDLLEEEERIIGSPDAGDWGGLYVEYNFDGLRKSWLIDLNKNNVPDKYHDFIDRVKLKIDQLN